MFLFYPCIYLVLCDFCHTLWLTLKHLVTEEGFFCFFSLLVTDGQFEWTSPFLTQRDWASEDDEWGCFKTSFSSVSPSLHFPPCKMEKKNAELTDFYTPTISKWRNSFNRSSEPEHCELDHHPRNTLWSHFFVFSNGRHTTQNWGHVLKLCSGVYRQPWTGDTLHRDTELNFLATILLFPTIPRENSHIFFPIVSCFLKNPFCIWMDMVCVTTNAVNIEIVVGHNLHASLMKPGLAPSVCHTAIKASTNQVIFLCNGQKCFVFVCIINVAVIQAGFKASTSLKIRISYGGSLSLSGGDNAFYEQRSL